MKYPLPILMGSTLGLFGILSATIWADEANLNYIQSVYIATFLLVMGGIAFHEINQLLAEEQRSGSIRLRPDSVSVEMNEIIREREIEELYPTNDPRTYNPFTLV